MSKFKKLLKIIKDKKDVYIQPHNFPDPDGIAAAFALCELIKHHGINTKIFYFGALQRSIMVSMIHNMKIDIHAIENPILGKEDNVIVVDCSPSNSNVMNLGGKIIGVIDHHEFVTDTDYPFTDIRPDVGSTSSIIASYYFEMGITPSKDVATALAVGLNIDTGYLTRKITKFDLKIYSELIDKIDIDAMRFIIINNLELKDIEHIKTALDNFRTRGGFLMANAGDNQESNFTGIISDFFLSLKEIDFVVIYTVINAGIILSVRNLNPNWNAARIIQDALEGVGTGGGHKHMAGGFIKFADAVQPIDEKHLFEKFCKVLYPDG